jgi:tRNA pseudouridine55 synthase
MHGVLIVDKPAGPTSAEVVRRVKAKLGRAVRVGHLGTLDPFATGVLPILIGEATKLASILQQGEKEYCGLIKLGAETDTLDSTGKVVRAAALPDVSPERLGDLVARFSGIFEQTPPVFSAIKRAGVPLYRLARRGEDVSEPPPRTVEIKKLDLIAAAADSLGFSVICSPGMYVRSLARDLGAALGSAGHLGELRRLRNGNFRVEQAAPLASALASLERGDLGSIIGLRAALGHLPEIEVDGIARTRLRNGDPRALDGLAPRDAGPYKVVAAGSLIALAEPSSRVTSTILRIFNDG